MKTTKSQTVTSLLTALFFVVAFVLTGCGADTLTGPDFGPETTVQSDGGGGAEHNTGNNNGNSGGNKHGNGGGGAEHNTGNNSGGGG